MRDRTIHDDIAAFGTMLLEASHLVEVKGDGKIQQGF